MTDASYDGIFPATRAQTPPLRLPAPLPLALPVFIHDCATPLAGETLLSLLMKRLSDAAEPPDAP